MEKPYTPFEIHGPAFLQAILEGRDLDAFEIAYQAGKADAEQAAPENETYTDYQAIREQHARNMRREP